MYNAAQASLGKLKLLLDGDATSAVGTAYESTDGQYAALVSAVAGPVRDPQKTLDVLFGGLPQLHDVAPTHPGPMGGEARCGKGEDNGLTVDLCAWADGHTIGMITWLSVPKTGNPASQLVSARAQIEKSATSPSSTGKTK
ncbi:hypothetical protein LQ51_12415 [Micromonospora sp. HK10]|nr:hypothetical protein LQ51_12415 [Micromonospora sp. HK10]